MSRLGSQPIVIPSGVTVAVDGDTVKVKGPKGEISWDCHSSIQISVEDGSVLVGRRTQERIARSMHGTARQLVNNMVLGVSEGFSRTLEIEGVGYNAKLQGKKLVLSIGARGCRVRMPRCHKDCRQRRGQAEGRSVCS